MLRDGRAREIGGEKKRVVHKQLSPSYDDKLYAQQAKTRIQVTRDDDDIAGYSEGRARTTRDRVANGGISGVWPWTKLRPGLAK